MRGVRVVVALVLFLIPLSAHAAVAQAPDTPPPDTSPPDSSTPPENSTPPEDSEPPSDVITGPLISWSLVPADAEGQPTDEVSFRLEVEAGATITDQALLTNHSEETVTFTIAGADGVVSAEGNFDILPPGEESTDIGTWIEVQPTIEVPAGESALVPFTITVPADATPGDHPGGIVAGVSRVTESADGPRVGFNTRVGVRIHLRVAGDIEPAVTITDLKSTYDPSWNPFAPGSVHVSYTVTNTGNVRVGSSQQADIAGLFGLPTGADTGPGEVIGEQREILPGQSATVDVVIEGVWPMGRLSTELVSTQDAVGEDPAFTAAILASATATTLAPPWTQAALLVLVIAAVLIWRKRRMVHKARMEKALAEAKEAGAREAAAKNNGASPADDAEVVEFVLTDAEMDESARPSG